MWVDKALITPDTLRGGRLYCGQYRQGYRFSIDAILLAHFSQARPQTMLLDLGAGSGVIGLLASFLCPTATVTCYELQDSLVGLINYNIRKNRLGGRVKVGQGDVRTRAGLVAETMDLVLCNPPYGKLKTGRLNPDSEQAIARHELQGEVGDFVKAAAFAVKNRGRVALVYPVRRLPHLFACLASARLAAKRLRLVHSYPGAGAKLALLEAVKNGGEELQVLSPLFIYEEQGGAYGVEVAAMLAG